VRTFAPGEVLTAYAEIYDNVTQSPHRLDVVTTIKPANSDGNVFSQSSEAAAAQSIPYLVEVPLKGLAPGAYVLRVESLFGQPPAGPAKGSAAGILATLKAGGSPKVFEDRTISPSYLPDVARATRYLMESEAPAGLYHCVNTGQCTWLEFAREMARLLGVEPRFTPVRMANVQLRAQRPMFCALSNEKLRSAGVDMPPWQDALARYLSAPPGASPLPPRPPVG